MVLDFRKEATEKCIGLKVGDRVRVISTVDGHDLGGRLGTVKKINRLGHLPIGVAFDDYFPEGHELDSNCESGHGRWGKEGDFILISREIVPKQLEGGKSTTMKNIYEVLVIDRKANVILLQTTVIGTSEANATLQVGMANSDKLKKVKVDNLDFSIISKGSYEEIKETKVVLEKEK